MGTTSHTRGEEELVTYFIQSRKKRKNPWGIEMNSLWETTDG
jgi:hypothetical protein